MTRTEINTASPIACRSFKEEVRKEWIEGSGVSEAYFNQLREDGFLTIHDASDLAKYLKQPAKGITGFRWAIKGIDPRTGEPMQDISQVKMNLPGKKYLCKSGGGSDALFLPLPNYYSWEQAIAEKGVYFTEGSKKAAVLCSLGIPAVAALSCTCFGTSTKDGKVREFSTWAAGIAIANNQPIRIIPDGDIKTNKTVFNGVDLAYKQHKDAGGDVRIIYFDSTEKGIDDHLATFEESERWDEAQRIMEQEYPIEQLREQLEKQFPKDEEGSVEDNDNPVYLAECFYAKHKTTLKFDLSQLTFRIWNDSYWESARVEKLHKMVKAFAQAEGFTVKTPRKYKDATEVLQLEAQVSDWESASNTQWMNFTNGILNLVTREFYEGEHKPELLLTDCLEHGYTPVEPKGRGVLQMLKEECPSFYHWAQQVQPDDTSILKMVAVMHMILTKSTPRLQAFVYIHGKPGTGKGTFNRLLEKLVGKTNHTSTRLDKLSNDYEIASLIDKQLVICPDEDRVYGKYSGLKTLTGGDTISYRHIYQSPARAKFNGTLVVTANDAVFAGDTTGLDRRMSVLGFNQVIKDRNPDIEQYLEDEIPALISVALWMPWGEVKAFISGKNDGDAVKAEKWQLKVEADAIARWMDESLYQDSSSYIPLSSFGDEDEHSGHQTLYSNYQAFCKESGYAPGNAGTFGKRLKEYAEFLGWNVESVRRVPAWGGTTRVNCIRGIKLRLDHDVMPTVSEFLSAEREDGNSIHIESDLSGQNTPLSGLCQGECQGKKPDNHAGCQGSQGKTPKLFSDALNEVEQFFEGESVELYVNHPVCPDTPDTASLSTLTPDKSVRVEGWTLKDGYVVGQCVWEREKYKTKDGTFARLPKRTYGGQRNGRHGIVCEVEEDAVWVAFYSEHEYNRKGNLILKNGKPKAKLTKMSPDDLVDYYYSVERIPLK